MEMIHCSGIDSQVIMQYYEIYGGNGKNDTACGFAKASTLDA